MDGRPVLELLVGPQVPPGVRDLLVYASRVCAPRSGVHGAARLATSLDARGLEAAVADPSTPLAVVVDREPTGVAVVAAVARADVVLAPPGVAVHGAATVLTLPRVDPWRHRPVPPFVRARWRRRLGLPDDFVVAFGYSPETTVGPRSVATVLALASVAAVRGEHALLALALGTPIVTDAATAGALGARDGRELVVMSGDDPDFAAGVGVDAGAIAAATALASRPVDCARLGRRARELVEAHHDPEAVARELTTRLGIVGREAPDAGSAAILRAACRELGLPPDGTVLAHRLLAAGRMERASR
jgi:hypothetical protein